MMEANASRYDGKAPNELDWTDAQRQKRAVAEYRLDLKRRPRTRKIRMIVVVVLTGYRPQSSIANRRR